jgi:hypothetical protein
VFRLGPDPSILEEEEDRLGRSALAGQIFRLASETPSEWPVTISINGEWGSGKSTLLQFVRRLALDRGHYVVQFNPWGYEDSSEMWLRLQLEIDKVLRELGVGPLRRIRTRVKSASSVLRNKGAMEQVPAVAGTIPYVGPFARPVASAGIKTLESWLKAKREDLTEASQVLKDKGQRIIVLVDDVDRARPDLVPQILYALSEVFGLAGFTFVLAFDPREVERALKLRFGAEHSGVRFLEKIINFPFWLPAPSEKQIRDVVGEALKLWAPFVPPDALDAVSSALPRNPRAARQFARLLNTLKSEVQRHGPTELDWPTLLRVFLFRTSWPRLADIVFESEESVQSLVYRHGIPLRNAAEESRRQEENAQRLAAACERAGLEDDDGRKRADALLTSIEGSFRVGVSGLLYLARLVEDPTMTTWKEFHECLSLWRNDPGANTLRRWLMEHARERGADFQAVARDFYETCINFRRGEQSEAADTILETAVRSRLENANDALGVMTSIALDIGGFSGDSGFLTSAHFRKTVDMALAWVQFNGDDLHEPVRAAEGAFLQRLVTEAEYSALEWIEALSGIDWMGGNPLAPARSRALIGEIKGPLMRKAFAEVEEIFRRPQGIGTILSGKKFETLDVLLSSDLWKSEFRTALLRLFRSGDPDVQVNLIAYLRNIASIRSGTTEAEALAHDEELIRAMWAGATKHSVNLRYRGILREIKTVFERIGEFTLDDPEWGPLIPPGQTAPPESDA